MNVNKKPVETHPLKPFFHENAATLMLGSFPPPKARWKMNFFYPNFQNDMWRIFGLVFFNDKNYFLSQDLKSFNEKLIREFLSEKGIALWDTAMEVRRLSGNASDKFLEVVKPIDIEKVLAKLPKCKTIILTGQKAVDVLSDILNFEPPKVGFFTDVNYKSRRLRIYRMPSSSRAYPLAIDKKAAAYAKALRLPSLCCSVCHSRNS